MPRTKLADKVKEEKKAEKKEIKALKTMHPEFLPDRGMWRVKYTGGGRLPAKLESLYCTRADAQIAIDLYLQGIK